MPRPRHRRLRLLGLGAVLFLAVIAGLYVVGRLRADHVAISVEQRAPAETAAGFDGTLRIGCYNIAHGRGTVPGGSNWDGGSSRERRERLESIGQTLRDLELDVAVLNEVDFAAIWSDHVDQAEVIAAVADFPYVVRQRNVDVWFPFIRLRFGNAILSRFPVRSTEFVPFEPFSRSEHIFAGNHESVIAHLELPDGAEFAVWSIHLESRDRPTRELAAEKIIGIAKDYPVPLVLAGDFNSSVSPPDAASPTAIDMLHTTDLFRLLPVATARGPGTFPTLAPERAIDWILAPRSWEVVASRVVTALDSDHLPVAATLRIASHEAPVTKEHAGETSAP